MACPVAALNAWLEAAGITSEPMFRAVRQDGAVTERLSALSVADIVKNERLSNAQDMWLLGHHFDGRQRYV